MASAAARFIGELSMDVLVKSFNRAYCLDRCLFSLGRHARRIRSIRVLDAGTPEKYLGEIERRHPRVEIVRSEDHAELSARVEVYRAGDPPVAWEPPWAFWRSGAETASPRFLLLEDGQWLAGDVDLGVLGQLMKARGCVLVRLRDGRPESGSGTPFAPGLCRMRPWYLKSRFHTLVFRALLSRWLDPERRRAAQAAALSIHSGVFDRAFWLEAAAGPGDTPEIRAARWAFRHPGALFAHAAIPLMAETRCSPGGIRPRQCPGGPDMLLFDKLLNESWFADRFDACAGLPDDFSRDRIAAILDEAREPGCTPEKWALWLDQFSENAAP